MPYHTIPYHTMPCYAMPCHAMPCHTVPYPTTPHHTTPHHTTPHHTTPHHTIPYHTIPYHTRPYHTTPRHTTLYHTTLYHTIPYYTIPHYTIPYHIISYHAILYHTTLHHTIPHYTIPYHTIPYHTIPYHTIPYHTNDAHCYFRNFEVILPQGVWSQLCFILFDKTKLVFYLSLKRESAGLSQQVTIKGSGILVPAFEQISPGIVDVNSGCNITLTRLYIKDESSFDDFEIVRVYNEPTFSKLRPEPFRVDWKEFYNTVTNSDKSAVITPTNEPDIGR